MNLQVKAMDFSSAYRFADNTINAIRFPEAFGFDQEVLGDFFGYGEDSFYLRISKPQKNTLLHEFIHSVNYSGIEWETGHCDAVDLIETYTPMIAGVGVDIPKWFTENQLSDYTHELDELLFEVSRVFSEAAFHLLFSDRDFLFLFSNFIGDYVKKTKCTDNATMKKDGVVRRCSYLPQWLKNAVYHRDKGRCQICTEDLTKLIVPIGRLHFDHMLPLEESGTNDPTNFQLLCETCNTSKGKNSIVKKQLTYTFW